MVFFVVVVAFAYHCSQHQNITEGDDVWNPCNSGYLKLFSGWGKRVTVRLILLGTRAMPGTLSGLKIYYYYIDLRTNSK